MNSDIRISVEFWSHPKTGRLIRDIGLEGVRSLQILWCWVATNKPDGILSGMDDFDIEFAADWRGDPGKFFSAIDGRWIDCEDGVLMVHDWLEHNPWASDATNRSDIARLSRLGRENKENAKILRELGVTGITKKEYQLYKRSTNVEQTYYELNTNSTTPTPDPVPALTTPDQEKKKPIATYVPSYTYRENDDNVVLDEIPLPEEPPYDYDEDNPFGGTRH